MPAGFGYDGHTLAEARDILGGRVKPLEAHAAPFQLIGGEILDVVKQPPLRLGHSIA